MSSQLHKLADMALFALGYYLAHWVRATYPIEVFGGTREIYPFEHYVWLYAFLVPGVWLILRSTGFYQRQVFAPRRLVAWQLAKGSFWAVGLLILVTFLFKRHQTTARSVFIYFGVVSFGLVWLKEELVRLYLQSRMGQQALMRKVILAGSREETARLRQDLVDREKEGLKVVAQFNLNEAPLGELVELLHEHSANGVLVASQHAYFGQIEAAIEVCEREGVEVWLLADFFKTQLSRTTVDDFYGRPMLVFRTGPETSWQALAKWGIDLTGSFLLLCLLCPFMALFALLIRRSSPGPVFFRQLRSGLNGEPFVMLKFRSMCSDAEQRKQELEALNEMSGPVFKVTNDPRVTPIGRLMRKYSIDEWPQLINVLRGEMSLVGPRPLPVDEVRRFDDLAHRRRLSVKPGLTCLWQISGRNNVKDFKEWVRLDLEYIDNWSLWLDLKILLRTIPVVLMGTGAR